MFLLLAIVILSVLIANYIGTKRYIGFGWALFFCLTGSILLGGLVVGMSSRKTQPPKNYTDNQKVFGWILVVLGIIAFLGLINMVSKSDSDFTAIGYAAVGRVFSISLFTLGLGVYLINCSNFNKAYYSNPHVKQTPISGNTSVGPMYTGGHNGSNNVYPTNSLQKAEKQSIHNKEFNGSNPYSKN